MQKPWLSIACPIAAIFSFRMLGLFLLIPVFSANASHLSGATPSLIGIALGSYGLTQGILQIPFGMLSDHFGRKPVIYFGLAFFAVGSLIGAFANSIYAMIIARTLQGTGAIGSVLIALLADLTTEQNRTKAMAVIGGSIGISFSLAMILGPLITAISGLDGIFYLTTILALLGIVMLNKVIPEPPKINAHLVIKKQAFKDSMANGQLQLLNLGIFIQHAVLTATFFAVPILLKELAVETSWQFYLPLVILSFLIAMPVIFYSERKKHGELFFIMAIFATALAQVLIAFNLQNAKLIFMLMLLYFIGFNFIEATLPSKVSKKANAQYKGTAMGIYSTSQFLGIFFGGLSAGLIFSKFSYTGVFLANSILCMIWLFVNLSCNNCQAKSETTSINES